MFQYVLCLIILIQRKINRKRIPRFFLINQKETSSQPPYWLCHNTSLWYNCSSTERKHCTFRIAIIVFHFCISAYDNHGLFLYNVYVYICRQLMYLWRAKAKSMIESPSTSSPPDYWDNWYKEKGHIILRNVALAAPELYKHIR